MNKVKRASILRYCIVTILCAACAPLARAQDEAGVRASLAFAQAEQTFGEGLAAHHDGDHLRALEIWRPVAKGGHARARASIGYLYFEGLGVPPSDQQAMAWFAPAAFAREPNAQYHLGLIYLRGVAVEKNPTEAYMWCNLAMSNGFAMAHHCRDTALSQISAKQSLQAEARGRDITGSENSPCPASCRTPQIGAWGEQY